MEETTFKTKLKKDDEVIVVAGRQKGKRGKIMTLDKKNARVVVQGVNRVKRFQRPSQENPKGGTVELEQSMPISNIMFYDAKAKKGVRLGFKVSPDGKKVRVTRPDGREV
ncbi:MAG: 50S ribosomal protein L24 [Spirochaetia bacterium]|nr:50S ribosomal protein L24 [Spirochaetia bacterium]